MSKLLHKKVNYLMATKEYMAQKEVNITAGQILFILYRFLHYTVAALVHGYTVSIVNNMKFSMYYVNSSDFEYIDGQNRFARSGAIHGVFFSVLCEGKLPDKYKAEFKPAPKFRQLMEEYLDDPDLAYKLIT